MFKSPAPKNSHRSSAVRRRRRTRRTPRFQQQNQKMQVLHLVSLSSQNATLSLPQLYRICTELHPRAHSAVSFPTFYFLFIPYESAGTVCVLVADCPWPQSRARLKPETMRVTFEEFSPTYDFFDHSVLQKHTEREFTMN